MKEHSLSGLVGAAIVLFICLLIPVLLAVFLFVFGLGSAISRLIARTTTNLALALLTVLLLALGLCDVVKKAIARTTTSGRHYRLLSQLYENGIPPPEVLNGDDYWSWCPNHDQSKCMPRTCPISQADEYYRLVKDCIGEHVPEWRVRWVANNSLVLF